MAPRSAIATSPGVTPLAARRAGDSVTSISRGSPPVTRVSATSVTVRISSSRWTATSRSALALSLDEWSVSASTGTSSMECGLTIGGSAPGGAWSRSERSFAWTLTTLASWFSPTLKRTVTMA